MSTAATQSIGGNVPSSTGTTMPAGAGGNHGLLSRLRLANLRISQKLFLLLAELTLVAGIVGYMGLSAISTLVHDARNIDATGNAALMGARMNRFVVALNRAEFEIVANPSADTIKNATRQIDVERASFEKDLARIRKVAGAQDKAEIEKIASAYKS